MFNSFSLVLSSFLGRLFNQLRPVDAVKYHYVRYSVVHVGDGGSKPNADNAPVSLEDQEADDRDTEAPVGGKCHDSTPLLLPRSSDGSLPITLSSVKEHQDQEDRPAFVHLCTDFRYGGKQFDHLLLQAPQDQNQD